MHILKNPEFRAKLDSYAMEADPSGQLKEFIQWMDDRKLLYNTATNEVELQFKIRDEGEFPTLFAKNNKLEIMLLDYGDGRIKLGVDPKGCFDKINRCAITAYFPMKKDKVTDLTDHLDELLTDNKKFKEFFEFSNHWDQYDPYE